MIENAPNVFSQMYLHAAAVTCSLLGLFLISHFNNVQNQFFYFL
jgi:hypothetical protein